LPALDAINRYGLPQSALPPPRPAFTRRAHPTANRRDTCTARCVDATERPFITTLR
jgi:hypothetical protein